MRATFEELESNRLRAEYAQRFTNMSPGLRAELSAHDTIFMVMLLGHLAVFLVCGGLGFRTHSWWWAVPVTAVWLNFYAGLQHKFGIFGALWQWKASIDDRAYTARKARENAGHFTLVQKHEARN